MPVHTLSPEQPKGQFIVDALMNYFKGKDIRRQRALEERRLGLEESLAQARGEYYRGMGEKALRPEGPEKYSAQYFEGLGYSPEEARAAQDRKLAGIKTPQERMRDAYLMMENALSSEEVKVAKKMLQDAIAEITTVATRRTKGAPTQPAPAREPPTTPELSALAKKHKTGEAAKIGAGKPTTEIGKAMAKIVGLELTPEQVRQITEKLKAGAEIDVRSPEGVLGTVPAEKLNAALEQGYTLVFE